MLCPISIQIDRRVVSHVVVRIAVFNSFKGHAVHDLYIPAKDFLMFFVVKLMYVCCFNFGHIVLTVANSVCKFLKAIYFKILSICRLGVC